MSAPRQSGAGSPVEVVDLRGRRAPSATAAVLHDVSGRRSRRLRAGGRLLFALLAVWLGALLLAGLGVLPTSGVPLGGIVTPSTAPTSLPTRPATHGPTASERRPALPAGTSLVANAAPAAPGANPERPGSSVTRHPSGGSGSTPVIVTNSKGVVVPGAAHANGGSSSTAPGQTSSSPGQAGTAPGQTKTTSAAAPGHTTTTGSSATAPGHVQTPPGQVKHGRTSTTSGGTITTPTHGKGAGASGGTG
jgi:hypothetical protein